MLLPVTSRFPLASLYSYLSPDRTINTGLTSFPLLSRLGSGITRLSLLRASQLHHSKSESFTLSLRVVDFHCVTVTEVSTWLMHPTNIEIERKFHFSFSPPFFFFFFFFLCGYAFVMSAFVSLVRCLIKYWSTKFRIGRRFSSKGGISWHVQLHAYTIYLRFVAGNFLVKRFRQCRYVDVDFAYSRNVNFQNYKCQLCENSRCRCEYFSLV